MKAKFKIYEKRTSTQLSAAGSSNNDVVVTN